MRLQKHMFQCIYSILNKGILISHTHKLDFLCFPFLQGSGRSQPQRNTDRNVLCNTFCNHMVNGFVQLRIIRRAQSIQRSGQIAGAENNTIQSRKLKNFIDGIYSINVFNLEETAGGSMFSAKSQGPMVP